MKYRILRIIDSEKTECRTIEGMIRSGKSCDEVAEFMVSGAPKKNFREIFDDLEVFDEKIMESDKYLIAYTDCGLG